MRRPTQRLADQDRAFTWYYRVIGSTNAGTVTGSEIVYEDKDLEAAHDRIMALPGTTSAETMGPFAGRRA